MKQALSTVKTPIDYINPHATSTPVGDEKEIEAIRAVFGDKIPPISATKSLTGHSLGATGVQCRHLPLCSRCKMASSANPHISTRSIRCSPIF